MWGAATVLRARPTQDVETLKDAAKGTVDVSRASALLGKKVDQLIGKLEQELVQVGCAARARESACPEGLTLTRGTACSPSALCTPGAMQVEKDAGTTLKLIQPDATGAISVADLERVLTLIKHRPADAAQMAAIIKRAWRQAGEGGRNAIRSPRGGACPPPRPRRGGASQGSMAMGRARFRCSNSSAWPMSWPPPRCVAGPCPPRACPCQLLMRLGDGGALAARPPPPQAAPPAPTQS